MKNGHVDSSYVLITGGAGFIGTNLAHRLLSSGRTVLIFDDLSRPGVDANLAWLRHTHGERLRIVVADVRNRKALRSAVHSAEHVFHFAAQVAVTTSVLNPRLDCEVNIGGTLNILEELRAMDNPPPLLFTSTNKVYGALPDMNFESNGKRYQPVNSLREGVNECYPLDFYSPYGCSKGSADQYVLDYSRTFGLTATVFRMSCIYGLHQMGCEDQGWVAHFLIRAIENKPVVIYGTGMQVRDVLFADDLMNALLLAQTNAKTLSGHAFNIGGGVENSISLLELLEMIASLDGKKVEVRFLGWRPGDQRYYVSDTRRFQAATGWTPKIDVAQGVTRLYRWLVESRLRTPAYAKAVRGAHAVRAY